jgi:iron(III) transport system substrate-binding protein
MANFHCNPTRKGKQQIYRANLKKGGNMFRLFSYKNFFSTTGKALMLASFLLVVLQAPNLNAQSIVEKAKKEGKLTFYSGLTIPDSTFVGNVFMKKYPFIKFDFIRLRAGERVQRAIMERHGNIKIADVMFSLGAELSIFRKEGLIQKYVSPEAKDWPEGFQDPEGYWTTFYTAYFTWIYNTRMVSEKEAPKRYEDLLDPKWKGKIGMSNREFEWYKGILDLMGREKGLQFMKRLADQDIRLNNGRTLTAQLMVSGEFPIALGVFHRALQMKKKGAPLHWASFPTPTLAGMRALVLHIDSPHPNAGKLFIDFMLSKEGQNTLNKIDRHPVRMDVKVDPVLEKVRRNLFPIKPTPAEVTAAHMKEFYEIFSVR